VHSCAWFMFMAHLKTTSTTTDPFYLVRESHRIPSPTIYRPCHTPPDRGLPHHHINPPHLTDPILNPRLRPRPRTARLSLQPQRDRPRHTRGMSPSNHIRDRDRMRMRTNNLNRSCNRNGRLNRSPSRKPDRASGAHRRATDHIPSSRRWVILEE
jgi:hypothetical protein